MQRRGCHVVLSLSKHEALRQAQGDVVEYNVVLSLSKHEALRQAQGNVGWLAESVAALRQLVEPFVRRGRVGPGAKANSLRGH